MNTASSPKIAALDGLRAVAVMLVLFRHCFYMFSVYAPQSVFPRWVETHVPFFLNGWIGVDLFFVLSGFLIARPFINGQTPDFKIYALKRGLRIIPAYYAVLLLCVAGFFPGYVMPVAASDLPLSFLYHLLFLQDYFPSNINVVFWSLGVEEKFYILAPLLVGGLVIIYRKNMALCAASIALIVLLGVLCRIISFSIAGSPDDYAAFFHAARSPFHCCLDPLLMGVSIAFFELYVREKGVSFSRVAPFVFYLSASGLVLIMAQGLLLEDIGFYTASFQPLLIAFVMGGLVWAGVAGGCPSILGALPLRFVARISYSLYLVHLPLWPLSYKIAEWVMGAGAQTGWFIVVFTAVFIAISFGAAIALHYYVERPFLQIKDRLSVLKDETAPSH